ncbi:MAG: hypothetical protein ACHP7N_07550 [Caulobacterales bacterium]
MSQTRRHQALGRQRLGAVATSIAAHGALLAALIVGQTAPARLVEPEAINVSLLRLAPPAPPVPPPPAPKPALQAAAPKETVEPAPTRSMVRHATPTEADALPEPPARADGAPSQGSGLTDAQLAGAASAGSGSPGGSCDMARRVQTALRRDPLVQAALSQGVRAGAPTSKAIMIWDGDWVQSPSEDGKGLAAVREAMMWEIAFAPKACRTEPVRGLVLFSMNEAPGAARLVVGQGEWRWSDLLVSGSGKLSPQGPLLR